MCVRVHTRVAQVAAGKTPFFLKRRETKELELQSRSTLVCGAPGWLSRDGRARAARPRFESLKAAGSLDRAMTRRRKKNAAKDRKRLPKRRRVEGGGSLAVEGGDG